MVDGGQKLSTYSGDSIASSILSNADFVDLQHKFDQAIQDLPAYGPTLARIKTEYEALLSFVTDTNRVRVLLQLERDKQQTDETTIRNFTQRKAELEVKYAKLLSENQRLKNEIDIVRDISAMRRKEKERKSSAYHKQFPVSSALRRSMMLPTHEAIDIDLLGKELNRLKQVLDEIKYNTDKRYVPQSHKDNLQRMLLLKEKEREKLEKENKYFCHLYLQLCECIKASKVYYTSAQDDSSPPSLPLSSYILQSTVKITWDHVQSTLETLAQEDPDEEKEAEFILHCCQRFNELFDSEQYSEAALLAATSPKGVLRTMETLNKFKSVTPPDHAHSPESPSPLMVYCSALMDSASVYPPVTMDEARECLECALIGNETNTIAKWLSHDVLPVSKEMGVYLYERCRCQQSCQCQCCLLALVIFRKLSSHFEESLCLAKLGKYNIMLSLVKELQYSKNDIASLLAAVPCSDFALFLVAPPTNNEPSLHLFEALYVLAQSQCPPEKCIQLVKSYAILKSTSWQEVIRQETKLKVELVSSLIPILSRYSELDHLLIQLTVSQLICTVLTRACERIQQTTMSHQSSSLTSSYTGSSVDSNSATPTINRPTLQKSQRIDEDNVEDNSESCDSSEKSCDSSGSDYDSTST